MRNAVPVEHLLLLLCANAVVLVEEVKEGALGFLEGCVGASLEVSEVGKNAFLEFLGILDGTTEGLKSEG